MKTLFLLGEHDDTLNGKTNLSPQTNRDLNIGKFC